MVLPVGVRDLDYASDAEDVVGVTGPDLHAHAVSSSCGTANHDVGVLNGIG